MKMINMLNFVVIALFNFVFLQCSTPSASPKNNSQNIEQRSSKKYKQVAEQLEAYLPLLRNQKVGMVVNPTSIIDNKTLVDSLLSLKINIVKIFGPETWI